MPTPPSPHRNPLAPTLPRTCSTWTSLHRDHPSPRSPPARMLCVVIHGDRYGNIVGSHSTWKMRMHSGKNNGTLNNLILKKLENSLKSGTHLKDPVHNLRLFFYKSYFIGGGYRRCPEYTRPPPHTHTWTKL